MKKLVKRKSVYKVRGADGTKMPLHASVQVVSGARPQVFTPETIIEVRDCALVRRRIASGDMVEVKTSGIVKKKGS